MAVALRQTESLTANEVAEQIAELAVREQTSVAQAATTVLADAQLDEEATETLIRHGAMALANGYLHRARGWTAEALPENEVVDGRPFPLRGPTPQQRHDDLQRIALQDATGSMKPLAAFTIADCEAFRSMAVAQINGWSTKQGVMEAAVEQLTKHKKDRISDLPMQAYGVLADAARAAWS